MEKLILRSRHRLLIATLALYLLVIVAEGMITGREPRLAMFDNPFFELRIRDLD